MKQGLWPSPFYPPTLVPRQLISDGPATKVPELPKEFPPLPSCDAPTEQDAKDKGTPDQWIVRDERLVRLTGRWPFNSEPPLPDLWEAVSAARL